MNAQELTKEFDRLASEYAETKKTVIYLEDEVKKLRLLVNDMRYDLKDVMKSERHRKAVEAWQGCQ